MFKIFIFSGASSLKNWWIDPEIVESNKQVLYAMGGESVTLETPDGDKIDGMYLSAQEFKKIVTKYSDLIEETDASGKIVKKLMIKEEFLQKSYPHLTEKGMEFKNLMESLNISLRFNRINGKVSIQVGIPLDFSAPEMDKNTSSQPTALICPGALGNYPNYKNLALSYLFRGMDVMMFDYRGYGESEGSPTEDRLKLDVETAYQYLASEKKVKNKDLIVHGHCLGVGPASDLAARRPGVHLISDRGFCEYREVARQLVPIIGKIIHAILPWIVNYNTGENLKKIEGDIAIFSGSLDAVIPAEEIENQINNLSENKSNQNFKYHKAWVPHEGNWHSDLLGKDVLDSFLSRAGLLRRLF